MQAIRLPHIDMATVFVELTAFVAFASEWWDDEALRRLQNVLLATPDAVDVI
jgi:hypothetical protein